MAFACISIDWTVSERYGPSEFEVVRMGRPTYYLDDKAEWALRHGGHIDKGIRDDNGKLMALPDLIPAEDDSYDDEVEAISQRGSGDSSLFGLIALAGIFAVGERLPISSQKRRSQTKPNRLSNRSDVSARSYVRANAVECVGR